MAGLVLGAGSDDRGVQLADPGGELASRVALVADHGLSTMPAATLEELQSDFSLVTLR